MFFPRPELGNPLPAGVQVFASGANQESEIRGFARLGIPVGVSVNHLNEKALSTLIELGRPVMVDSGAFSETAVALAGLTTVAPISTSEWRRRLALYLRLACALGKQAYFVAPDKVGDQQETLSRLAMFRRELVVIHSTGARILLPMQIGDLSHDEFFCLAQRKAGVGLVPAMPMRKAATSMEALLAFLKNTKPRHVHLLGIGIDNHRSEGLIRAIQDLSATTTISMDSNRLRAVTGKNRPLTQMESKLRATSTDCIYGTVSSPVLELNGHELDYTDLVAFPSLWAASAELSTVADRVTLPSDCRAIFIEAPDLFLQSPIDGCEEITWIEHPVMAHELDMAWERFVERKIRSDIRSAAIISVFRDARITEQI